MDAPDGRPLQWDNRRAYYAEPEETRGRFDAHLDGGGGSPSLVRAAEAKKATTKKPSDADLKKLGEMALAAAKANTEAQLDSGPSVRRVARGTAANNYNTELTPGAEESFRKNRKRLYGEDTGEDYDLRGAFAAGETHAAGGHMTDRFKKPNHPTFSDESQYAEDEPEKAGHWNGEKYIAPRPVYGRGRDPFGRSEKDFGAALADMKPYAYAYKDEFTPPNQSKGEVNVGPTVQDMRKNEITASATKVDPESGYGLIDLEKAQKLNLAAAGYLARKQRDQEARLQALEKK